MPTVGENMITVDVGGGGTWHSFTRITISYSAKQAVRAFAFTGISDDSGVLDAAWHFMPGTEAQIKIDGELVCHGYVNDCSPSFDKSNHSVEVQGRSKSQDTNDSSAIHDTGEFKNKTLGQIAKELDKQGVGFNVKSDSPPLEYFRVNVGETVFGAVERIARKYKKLLIGEADGSITIADGGKERVHPPLIEGQNVLAASAKFSDGDKHSEYKVRGQRAFGVDKKSLRIEATSKDSTVKRNRPKVITHESDTTEKEAKDRADHHKNRQSGEGTSASVKVSGARDANGTVWRVNTLIYVHIPKLRLDMDMLIESVQIQQESGGTLTTLSLVLPEALGSEAKPGSKASKEWTG